MSKDQCIKYAKKEQVLFLRVVSNKYKSKYKQGKSNV